jgi:hypothetical protein
MSTLCAFPITVLILKLPICLLNLSEENRRSLVPDGL